MAQWHAGNTSYYVDWGYQGTPTNPYITTEGLENAEMAWGVFGSLGWNLPAVCATLGVCCWESTLNPWKWENNVLIASYDTDNLYDSWVHGYGLNQFTPAGTYIDGARGYFNTYAPNFLDIPGQPTDGDSQCRFIHKACTELYAYFKNESIVYQYPYMPFSTYIGVTDSEILNGTITFENLVYQWMKNYCRGGETTTSWNVRVNSAKQLYTHLSGVTPPEPPTPPGPFPPVESTGKWWKFLPRLYRPF